MALRDPFRRNERNSQINNSRKEAPSLMAIGGASSDAVLNPGSTNQDTSLRREVGLLRTPTILIGCSIATSVYVTPGIVFRNAGLVGAALLIWLLAGVSQILSGLCYMELATLLPASGGGYAYVMAGSKSLGRFGDFVPFMYAWNFLVLADPLGVALQAHIFASYVLSIPYLDCVPPYAAKVLLSVAFTCLAAALNSFAIKLSSKFQGSCSMITCAILIALIVTGFITDLKVNHFHDAPLFSPDTTAGELAVAYFGAQLTTGGWRFVTNFAGEISNPSRNIPRALLGGILIVTLLVFLLNLVFFIVLDATAVASTEVIAVTFVTATWGNEAARLLPVVISLGIFGTASASFFANIRVMLAAARQHHLPAIFSMVTVDTRVPLTSVLLRALLIVACTFLGSVTFMVEAVPLIYFLNDSLIFGSLFVLRYSMKDAPRPYRVPTVLAVIQAATNLLLLGVRFVQPVGYLPYVFPACGIIAGGIYYVAFIQFRITLPGTRGFTCLFQKVLKSSSCTDELEIMLHEKL